MSEANGEARRGLGLKKGKPGARLALSKEPARVARLCAGLGLEEPVLDHEGFNAIFLDNDLVIVVIDDNLARTLKRLNRAARLGYFVLACTREQWDGGEIFATAAKVARANC